MNLKWVVPLVIALCPAVGVCEDESIEAKLGATFKRVWFKGTKAFNQERIRKRGQKNEDNPTPATPLVGLEIDMDTLKKTILSHAKTKDESPAELLKRIGELNSPKGDKTLWKVDAKSLRESDPDYAEAARAPISFQHEEDTLVIIVNARGSYNDAYTLTFDLSKFLGEKAGTRKLVQRDIHFNPRTTFTVSTDFARNNATLLTQEPKNPELPLDEETNPLVNKKAKATQVDFSIGHDGFPNPLQHFFFNEHSYYKLKLSGTLSDQRFDSRSKIELSLTGGTDLFHLPRGLMSINGLRVLTSQSQRQLTALYEAGVRKGDNREHSDGYVASDDLLGTIYGEFALQLGVSQYKDIQDVPDPKRLHRFILRPRFRLGAKDLFKSKSSFLKVTGYVDVYYLLRDLGGADDVGLSDNGTGLREYFTLAFTIGTEAQSIKFSIEGGTNPAQGFAKVRPSYKLGIDFKF